MDVESLNLLPEPGVRSEDSPMDVLWLDASNKYESSLYLHLPGPVPYPPRPGGAIPRDTLYPSHRVESTPTKDHLDATMAARWEATDRRRLLGSILRYSLYLHTFWRYICKVEAGEGGGLMQTK